MFLGLRTVIYHVDNIDKAKQWYANALGVQPYFDQPFYVGFSIGGFELGLDSDMKGVSKGNNVVAYWGTEDIEKALARLLEIGAKENSGIQDVGGDIRLATVTDPFGNIFGIIENPQFKIG
jgi:predicted enzyme related to lactoylglutathione lyase